MRNEDFVAILQGVCAYGNLVGKPDERRPLERPRSRWEDNVKMNT